MYFAESSEASREVVLVQPGGDAVRAAEGMSLEMSNEMAR